MGASVAVLVVAWNAGNDLHRCLQQLRTQTILPRKVLVIDNASTDGAIGSLFARENPEVELLQLDRNVGFAAGNNAGLERVGDCYWVALLNPDAFPEPEWLESLLAAAQKHSEFQFFASRQLSAREPSQLDGCGDAYHVSGLHWRTGFGREALGFGESVREVFGPCAAAALYRTDALRKVGGFDENFFCYSEDVDLAFRLRLHGYRCLYVPDALVHHVGSATTGGQHSDFSVYHGHRNLVWTFVKDMPGMLFWLLLPLHVVLNLVSIFWFVLRGQGRVILKAKRDALLGLPKMWRKRKAVQSTRIATVREIWRLMDKHIVPQGRTIF